MLEWLVGGEPARSRVAALLVSRPVMSWINLGEVYYITHRSEGQDRAQHIVRRLRTRLVLDLPTPELILEAGAIKADHALAYADAFAVATTLAHHATLLTGDPEILRGDPTWPIEDLRRAE